MSVPQIYDTAAYRQRRARAERIGDSFLVREAADGLAERLAAVKRNFHLAADIGSRGESFAILKHHAQEWVRVDIDANEALELPETSLDLAVSVLALHAVNDLPGLLVQIRRALKPDGLLMAALFGGDTLRELRDAIGVGESETRGGISPRVAPFADVRDMGGLLQRAGFALPVADVERTTVRYRDFSTLISDLRAAGETNALAKRQKNFLKRSTLVASAKHYADTHADPDGRLRATFDIVYLTGWAPHESQQQPLRPGSAKMRLADALGTKEQSAGDIADPTRPKR
ncbi:MAG TPA: methyltransferase domain-containing protein [Rhizomicrobium sp.]|jgi:SAM-dependent methyltransferase|nr:methyltransferase domain-containing protein [Rhizomicrobium sp.]